MLEFKSVHAGYGPIEVLKGISLEVRAGEIVTLIGGNGAGKTTSLMALSGVVPVRSGEILFEGKKISGLPPHEIVARGVSQVPEGRKIFPRLTVMENLEMGAYLRRGDAAEQKKDLDHIFGLFPVLAERRAQMGGTLSGGEQQMLAIGRALMARPRLLLLDEPSLGLAPLVVARIFQVLRDVHAAGGTILLVEQNARMALKLADRGYVLENGGIALADTGAALLANPRVQEAYLGE